MFRRGERTRCVPTEEAVAGGGDQTVHGIAENTGNDAGNAEKGPRTAEIRRYAEQSVRPEKNGLSAGAVCLYNNQ